MTRWISKGTIARQATGAASPGTGGIIATMTLTLRAHVANGRLVVDESVDLPDGTEVQVAVVDGGDQLDEEDRARLHAAIEQAQDELDRGESIPAAQLLADLRSHRRAG
jgi:hypothetical protein